MESNHWLPLTEYALRSGMSISTLRRKIKSNSIEYRMEDGRYLIRGDELTESTGFASSDEVATPKVPASRPHASAAPKPPEVVVTKSAPVAASVAGPVTFASPPTSNELELLREEVRRMQDDNLLRWKALEARVSGIAKKLEFFSEQMAEAKMLVKLFEEKLDHRA